MKYLDRKKAREIVLKELEKEPDNIERVVVQLSGDEFWNTETIWRDGKFRRRRDFKCYEMSTWAIPVVRVYYKDGKEQAFDCYRTDEKFGKKIRKIQEERSRKIGKSLKEYKNGNK